MADDKKEAILKWGLGVALTIIGAVVTALWVGTNDRFDECKQRAERLELRVNQLERETVSRPELKAYVQESGPYIADRQAILQSLREVRKVGELKEAVIRLSVTMEQLGKSVEKINQKLDGRGPP